MTDDRGEVLSKTIGANALEQRLDWRQKTAFGQARQADKRRVAALTIAGVLGIIGVAMPTVSLINGATNVVGLVAMAVGSLVISAICFVLSIRWDRETVANFAKKAGWCGGCGYQVAELDAHEDGCTVCSECCAAWRLTE